MQENDVLSGVGRAGLLEQLAAAVYDMQRVTADEGQIRSPSCNLCTEHLLQGPLFTLLYDEVVLGSAAAMKAENQQIPMKQTDYADYRQLSE